LNAPQQPLFLCGATASGKSHLAITLAEALDGEIVNADAFQLYRGLETLTASPTAADRERVPHHLYAVLDPDRSCDAARYRQLATPVVDDILARGRTPIVTGGSGLYLKFLSHGTPALPAGDPALRAELAREPLAALVERLRRLDPAEAARTDLHNRRYVTRALEICLLAGRPCSELRDRWRAEAATREARLQGLLIQRPRPELHSRIEARSLAMLEHGAIDEVAALDSVSPTLEKAIGYREIRALLAGEADRTNTLARLVAATRRYAKRQQTWFRRERWLRPLAWTEPDPPPLDAALAALSNRL